MHIDLRNTALQKVGGYFGIQCPCLTTVTELGGSFLNRCNQIQHIDLSNTSLRIIGNAFASNCRNLRTVALPDTEIDAGYEFARHCHGVTVLGGSKARIYS